MTNPAWKQEERKVARALGGERNPLSGSNGKHTSGDVIQTPYYVDAKLSGAQSASGSRHYTLQREDVVEVIEQTRAEEKEAGLMTVRFKHCSDRYVILPITYWSQLLPQHLRDTREPPASLELVAQGTLTHRIHRQTLQKLDNLYEWDAGCQVIWHRWADAEETTEAIITWDSLLWLLDSLQVCPDGCGWQALNSEVETECPECGTILEGI